MSGAHVGPSTGVRGRVRQGRTSPVPASGATGPCSRPRCSTTTQTWTPAVEHLRPGPPQAGHRRLPAHGGADRLGVAGRRARTAGAPAPPGRRRAGPAPRPAAGTRRPRRRTGRHRGGERPPRLVAPGQLTEERRVADDGVEGPPGIGRAAVAHLDPRLGGPSAGPARRCWRRARCRPAPARARRRTAAAAAAMRSAAARRRPSPQAGSSTRTGAGRSPAGRRRRAPAPRPGRPAGPPAPVACTRLPRRLRSTRSAGSTTSILAGRSSPHWSTSQPLYARPP